MLIVVEIVIPIMISQQRTESKAYTFWIMQNGHINYLCALHANADGVRRSNRANVFACCYVRTHTNGLKVRAYIFYPNIEPTERARLVDSNYMRRPYIVGENTSTRHGPNKSELHELISNRRVGLRFCVSVCSECGRTRMRRDITHAAPTTIGQHRHRQSYTPSYEFRHSALSAEIVYHVHHMLHAILFRFGYVFRPSDHKLGEMQPTNSGHMQTACLRVVFVPTDFGCWYESMFGGRCA